MGFIYESLGIHHRAIAHQVIVFEGENGCHIMRYSTIYLGNIKSTCFSMRMVEKEECAEH